ncbi:hypothetical protein MF6394_01730 [Pseudomonas sp. MF6394]|jgi:hypothetical protein|uniref:hypothetical protein n=1 Tax=Pseudomonas fluorescens TaxID=294 RepID=UPI000657D869|nr:hypothetical protein [Pseudomonas fluorescens]OOW07000.1 hypothetical protein MF6394_01730 [Pseudomonas sp. MF6394]CEK42733.1 hypothetical protein PQBR44_0007 [Pseudomonas putida UWC1]
MSRIWTVVRFPNGSWSYGGSPSDPDYSECDIYSIEAVSPEAAVKSAQSKRSASLRKAKRQADKDASPPAAPIC